MKKELNKYKFIYESIKGKILNGDYPSGMRLPGQFALAKDYSVSAITSNRALNELEKSGLIERKCKSGSYVLASPRAMREIFIVTRDAFLSWLNDYWQGITGSAEEKGISCQMIRYSDPLFEEKLFQRKDKSFGVILLGFENHEIIDKLEKHGICHVVTATHAKIARYCAAENRRSAGARLLYEMMKAGVKKPVFLGNFEQANHIDAFEGYLEQAATLNIGRENGINVDEDNVLGKLKEIVSMKNAPDAVVSVGSGITSEIFPFMLKHIDKIKLGTFTEDQSVLSMKEYAFIASYSQRETGKLAFRLLCDIVLNKVKCGTTWFSDFEILKP